jgi:hypothetical protein
VAAEPEAYALAAVSQAPEPFRRLLSSIFGNRPGVVNAADWAVTQNGTPNMSVNVAAGQGLVLGSESSTQGGYFCQSLSVTNLAIGASNPTNPRRDLVVGRIRDNQYATGPTSAFDLFVVAGTPAASPSDPTVPANCLVIARVAVAALASTVVNANITDLRTTFTGQARASALGAPVVCVSTSKPTTGLYEGLQIYCTDIDSAQVWNGSAWIGLRGPGGPQPQFFLDNLASGTSTTDALVQSAHNAILVAPFPLTMIVDVRGDIGANGGLNTVKLTVADEAGAGISQIPGVYGGGYVTIKNYNVSSSAGFALVAKKDYAAGATCGFRVLYNVDTSNIFVSALSYVTFVPKLS